MIAEILEIFSAPKLARPITLLYLATFYLIFCSVSFASAGPEFSISEDGKTMTIENAPEMQVIAVAKDVTVRGEAKEIFSWGGNVTVEGKVSGDVAAFGGDVIQKEGAFIGGDVIVIGGTYQPESKEPLRVAGKETVVIGVFEEELRQTAQNPTQLFAPELSWAFFAQRILSLLFWFVVTMVFATIAPGAISRASARFQLSTLKVLGLGLVGFVIVTVGTIVSVGVLPEYLSVIFAMMALALLMLAYVFGRVAMQVSLGKYLQRFMPGNGNRSEALAIFIGSLGWTLLLSVPYIWTFALLALFAAGIGLVATARPVNPWKTS
jgi:hypothetical protein